MARKRSDSEAPAPEIRVVRVPRFVKVPSDEPKSPSRFTEEEIYRAICAAKRAGEAVTIDITAANVRLTISQISAQEPAKDSPPMRDVLRIEDLAKHWGITSATVRRAIDRGAIRHFRIGKKLI